MMGNSAIQSFVRSGAWSSAHSFHYECAWEYYREYKGLIEQLRQDEDDLRSSLKVSEEYLESLIHHETEDLHEKSYRAATSAHLYACMAIEGFINNYGTVRLGEIVYKSILERIGITEKISLLYLLCFEKVVLKTDPQLKNIRTMFDQRNALAHPKTKEMTPENADLHFYTHPKDLEITKTMQYLEDFLNEISENDKNISLRLTLKRPFEVENEDTF